MKWWQLHLRVARGETLEPVERSFYEAELAQMDAVEKSQIQAADLIEIRKLKQEIERLEAAHTELEAKSSQLDRQTWTLEGA